MGKPRQPHAQGNTKYVKGPLVSPTGVCAHSVQAHTCEALCVKDDPHVFFVLPTNGTGTEYFSFLASSSPLYSCPDANVCLSLSPALGLNMRHGQSHAWAWAWPEPQPQQQPQPQPHMHNQHVCNGIVVFKPLPGRFACLFVFLRRVQPRASSYFYAESNRTRAHTHNLARSARRSDGTYRSYVPVSRHS